MSDRSDKIMADLLKHLDKLEAENASLRRSRVDTCNRLLRAQQENERLKQRLADARKTASVYLGQAHHYRAKAMRRSHA